MTEYTCLIDVYVGKETRLVHLNADPNDPNTALVAKYDYDPYGNNRLDPNDPNESGIFAHANPFRFSTKYFDVETGLSYFGGRYYHATLGRWLNRDPIGELGGANLYTYAGNDPIDRIDPLGHAWTKCRGPHCGHDDPDDGGRCPRKGQPTRFDSIMVRPFTFGPMYPPPVPSQKPLFPPEVVIPCYEFCWDQGYTGAAFDACKLGCLAARMGGNNLEFCGPITDDELREACFTGSLQGDRLGPRPGPPPPPPFKPFGPDCSRSDCMTALGIGGGGATVACAIGCVLAGPGWPLCMSGCGIVVAGTAAFEGILECLNCPNL